MPKCKFNSARKICYIGLGSNLDNPINQINSAIIKIKDLIGVTLLKVSSFYLTKPEGYKNQPSFINAVIKIKTNLTPEALLLNLLKIESLHYRVRSENRNMPRTIDLDILFFENRNIKSEKLEIPHPRAKNRYFVLVPLKEIAPKFTRKFLGNIDYTRKFKLSNEYIKICKKIDN